MQYLLENLIKKERQFMRGSKYIVAVPTDVTEVEKRAFYDLVVHSSAKAKEVRIVERGIADAIGLGLDVQQSPGLFVVNLGAETTELSILAYGGVVLNSVTSRIYSITIDGLTYQVPMTIPESDNLTALLSEAFVVYQTTILEQMFSDFKVYKSEKESCPFDQILE